MKNKIRLRFAPSPTGPLHIGGLRTALFNYLFAKKMGGKMILRIEDTDQARFVEKSKEHIEKSLEWTGIDFDESSLKGGNYGPYKQSERKKIYDEYIEILIQKGQAYFAFDKREDLDAHRVNHEKKGKKFIYNAHNREKLDNSLTMSEGEIKKRIAEEPYVVRFKTPSEKEIRFEDVVRGKISVSSRDIDDKVLYKSDGMPTYHLANVVDDHLMEISHVVRGEEWLPSLALHVLIYKAFGWEPPEFAHLPLILKPTGKGKLSKRDGDKFGFPVYANSWKEDKVYEGFEEAGFLSEALNNYMVFLGWSNDGDKEIYSMKELIKDFSLEKINKAGAKFDPKKLLWINSQHIQKMSEGRLVDLVSKKNPKIKKEKMKKFIQLVRPRLETITFLRETFVYLFEKPTVNKQLIEKNMSSSVEKTILDFIDSIKEGCSEEFIKQNLYDCAKKNDLKFGKALGYCRLAIVGKMEGPDVIGMMMFIGIKETKERLLQGLKI